MATNTRIALDGYGQVELNQCAFRRDGRIEAQAAIDSSITAGYIENGMMLALDPVTRTVKYPTANGPALLNYTTEHMYDERLVGALKDFKLSSGSFLPRLGYLAPGDKFTTNCISYPKGSSTGEYSDEDAFWTAAGKTAMGTTPLYGHTHTDGSILVNSTSTNAFAQVVKATTMPDGQKALQFIAK